MNDFSKKNLKHNMVKSSEYVSFRKMKERCYNTNCHVYRLYGGRGIEICDRWKNSFANFFEDMGYKPSKKHSIERIDVNGNYCKENCRWATHKDQSNNRSNNVFFEHNGISLTQMQWAEKLGISRERIWNYMKKEGAIFSEIIESIEKYGKNRRFNYR